MSNGWNWWVGWKFGWITGIHARLPITGNLHFTKYTSWSNLWQNYDCRIRLSVWLNAPVSSIWHSLKCENCHDQFHLTFKLLRSYFVTLVSWLAIRSELWDNKGSNQFGFGLHLQISAQLRHKQSHLCRSYLANASIYFLNAQFYLRRRGSLNGSRFVPHFCCSRQPWISLVRPTLILFAQWCKW